MSIVISENSMNYLWLPWSLAGLGEDRDSIASFLFTWPDGDVTKNPIKLPKVGGPSLAVIDKPENGTKMIEPINPKKCDIWYNAYNF